MTADSMDVEALLGKSVDAEFQREMTGFAAQRLMNLEVGRLTGAGYGEKNPERLAQRNGYRERDRETRAGILERRIPKRAEGWEGAGGFGGPALMRIWCRDRQVPRYKRLTRWQVRCTIGLARKR